MANEKNPKEASNIFHSIMKASVSKVAIEKKNKPDGFEDILCPSCEEKAQIISREENSTDITLNCMCPNGHFFYFKIDL